MPFSGKSLIVFGLVLIIVGVILTVSPHIPWLGKLPGDIAIKKENFQFYFPITTCLVISVIVTFILYIMRR